RPLAATGDDPGRPTNNIDPDELAVVQSENRRFTSKGPDKRDEVSNSFQPEELQRCFVIMPFHNSNLQWVYQNIVAPAASKRGICERGDDALGSNVIMEDVLSK